MITYDYGRAIRVARARCGWTQKQLAHAIKVDQSFLSLLESGKRKPGIETLERIAEAIDMPLYVLVLLATPEYARPYAKDIGQIALEALLR